MRVLRPSSTCYIRWASKDCKESVKRQFSVPDSTDSSTCSGRCEHIWITRQEYERGRVATATLIRIQESLNIRIESMSVTGFRPIDTLRFDSAVFDRRKRRRSAGLTGTIALTKNRLRQLLHLNQQHAKPCLCRDPVGQHWRHVREGNCPCLDFVRA